jgi:YidC/Oxa1 family membrane protein insertase
MLIQVPVFFSLYKVLLITIEMRHAPFFGWIRDLSAQDPTNLFNLFGLIPWDPTHIPLVGTFLVLGAWPLIMGVTMWFQMKLNPTPPDPTQKMIFDWMPIIFTFMLAAFPAGLVIYWAWNNTLSVIQQSVIMQRHGAKIELWGNLKAQFASPRVLGDRLKLQLAKGKPLWDNIKAKFAKRKTQGFVLLAFLAIGFITIVIDLARNLFAHQ